MAKEKQSFFEKIIKSDNQEKRNSQNEEDSFPMREDRGRETAKNNQEGQLSVDVYETESSIVIESIVGGVKVEDVNISVSNNVLTVKGVRERTTESESYNYFVAECFWGAFSRSIILPVEVDPDRVKASMKNGILKITLPKLVTEKVKKIKIDTD